MKRMIPINTDMDGACSKTILAGYYKYGVATLIGDTFGTSGTSILEIYAEQQEIGSDAENCR